MAIQMLGCRWQKSLDPSGRSFFSLPLAELDMERFSRETDASALCHLRKQFPPQVAHENRWLNGLINAMSPVPACCALTKSC